VASAELIDITKLLEPVSEENPVGTDLRDDPKPDSLYQQIKQARISARAAERENMYEKNNNEALQHWKTINILALKIFSKHSKDLEIASWYIEAQVRLNGFKGLRDAFKLTKGLIEQYWDSIYPLPDEDGLLSRVAPLAGLNGEGAEGVLIAPIRHVPLCQGDSNDTFGLWQYQQSLDVQRITDPNTRLETIERNGYSLDDIEKAVNSSSEEFYIDLRDDVTDCIVEFKQINQLLDERCERDVAPPTSNIISVLDKYLGAINHLAKHKFPVELEESSDGSDSSSGSGQQAGPISSREAAFKQLHTISEFFLKTEPHSPISYIVAKAVKWGNMPLNELMGELIPDSTSREHFSSLTGVSIKSDDEN